MTPWVVMSRATYGFAAAVASKVGMPRNLSFGLTGAYVQPSSAAAAAVAVRCGVVSVGAAVPDAAEAAPVRTTTEAKTVRKNMLRRRIGVDLHRRKLRAPAYDIA